MSFRPCIVHLILVVLLGPALALPQARAQDCIDYSSYLHMSTQVPIENGSTVVAVSGRYVYMNGGAGDFMVFDTIEPEHPVLLASVSFPEIIQDLLVHDTYVYSSANETPFGGFDGVRIIDVSDPAQPQSVGLIYAPPFPGGMYIDGGLLYLTDWQNGLLIYGLDDPIAPNLLATLDTPGEARNLVVVDGVAFIADGHGGLTTADVHDPENPVLGNVVDTEEAFDVVVSGGFAYVADEDTGVSIFDVSVPLAPVRRATLDTPGQAHHVDKVGDLLYIADDLHGLAIADVSSPTHPRLLESMPVPVDLLDVQARGATIFGATDPGGLVVIDASNPRSAAACGSVPLLDPLDIVAAGPVAYSLHLGNLRTFDLEDPCRPAQLGMVATDWNYSSMAVDGGTAALVATDMTLLRLVDLVDPANPSLAGSIATASHAFDVAISDQKVFVAEQWEDGYFLEVISAADPEHPTRIASLPLSYAPWSVAITSGGTHALVGSDRKVRVYDVRNPSFPVLSGQVTIEGVARAMCVSGDRVYVAANTGGLSVLDLSDPTQPLLLGHAPSAGYARGVVATGHYAFLSDIFKGIYVFDVSDPGQPAPRGYLPAAQAPALAAHQGHVYVVEALYGLMVLSPQCGAMAGVPDLVSAFPVSVRPNPVAGEAHVLFTAVPGRAWSVDILDATGRRLRSLAGTAASAGPQSIVWDGRGANGRLLPAGVYFARVNAGGGSASRRVILVR